MKLKILLPYNRLLDEPVLKVTAETTQGSQGFLPHHLDYITSLVPGILSFQREQGEEQFLAVDNGMLVKCGEEITVCVAQASQPTTLQHLEALQDKITEDFQQLTENEREIRSAFSKLESQMMKHLLRE